MNEIQVTIAIPAPPDGWVYDGFRRSAPNEKWFDGLRWRDGETERRYPVAIPSTPPWKPSPELISGILLIFGPGWIAKNGDGSCKWHRNKPKRDKICWYAMNDSTPYNSRYINSECIPTEVKWGDSLFKIGEPNE